MGGKWKLCSTGLLTLGWCCQFGRKAVPRYRDRLPLPPFPLLQALTCYPFWYCSGWSILPETDSQCPDILSEEGKKKPQCNPCFMLRDKQKAKAGTPGSWNRDRAQGEHPWRGKNGVLGNAHRISCPVQTGGPRWALCPYPEDLSVLPEHHRTAKLAAWDPLLSVKTRWWTSIILFPWIICMPFCSYNLPKSGQKRSLLQKQNGAQSREKLWVVFTWLLARVVPPNIRVAWNGQQEWRLSVFPSATTSI